MKLTYVQREQLRKELSPAIERVIIEAADSLSENFLENAEMLIGDGADVINYQDIQNTLMKSIDELFARGTIMPATTKISGPAWSLEETEIFDPEFLEY